MTQYAIAVPMILVALRRPAAPADARRRGLPRLDPVDVHDVRAGRRRALHGVHVRPVHDLRPHPGADLQVLKLMVLGLGLCVNNGVAVLTGLVQHGGEFVRTPKSGSTGAKAGLAPIPDCIRACGSSSCCSASYCSRAVGHLPAARQHRRHVPAAVCDRLLTLIGWGSRPLSIQAQKPIKKRSAPLASVPQLPPANAATDALVSPSLNS